MAKPRILIFSLAYFPFVGGAEVAVKEITDRLPGYEFEIISADLKRGFWTKYFFPVAGYLKAKRLHKQKKYDKVWAIMANQAGMAAALFKRRFPEVPFLLTLQEGDDLNSWQYRLRLLGPKIFGVFKRADQIQVISNYLARWAKKMGATCPITVIPNGVDFGRFQPKTYQLKPNPIIITTSRLVEKNGVGDLIESLRYLPDNIHLQILGTGPLEEKLKNQTERLGLKERINFVGYVPQEKLMTYFDQADVFVRPSLSEGLGNSFLEAMAAGLPVIGTPVGGIPDFLEPGKTGWFCRVHDARSIAEKVEYVLNPRNARAVSEVIARARQLVEVKYSWDVLASTMSNLIHGKVK